LLSSSRCSRFSLWLNPCPSLQERFYTKAEEVEKDVTINVTNEFDPYDDSFSENEKEQDKTIPMMTEEILQILIRLRNGIDT
jgi:hypothetical protein